MILFLLGPSGSGKSQLASWVAADLDFLHLEIDRFPDGDGLDLEGLRAEWDHYWIGGNAGPLVTVLTERVANANRAGVILSFPGNLVPFPAQMATAEQAGVCVVLLYGAGADCLRSFLERERDLARGLDEGFWTTNNACSYAMLSSPRFDDYRLCAFSHGEHRPRSELVGEIAQRAG